MFVGGVLCRVAGCGCALRTVTRPRIAKCDFAVCAYTERRGTTRGLPEHRSIGTSVAACYAAECRVRKCNVFQLYLA